jgi:hypothetical protein
MKKLPVQPPDRKNSKNAFFPLEKSNFIFRNPVREATIFGLS